MRDDGTSTPRRHTIEYGVIYFGVLLGELVGDPWGRREVEMAAVDMILRSSLVPGDLGSVVRLHGVTYARENGFDATFEAYVAGPLAEFVRRCAPRERIWIAEREGQIVGCVAIVAASETEAQLRWFLVDPSARGGGLGRRLLGEAIAFARGVGYASVFLWTVSALTTAARLYREVGFSKVEEIPGASWGVEVVEERYVMGL